MLGLSPAQGTKPGEQVRVENQPTSAHHTWCAGVRLHLRGGRGTFSNCIRLASACSTAIAGDSATQKGQVSNDPRKALLETAVPLGTERGNYGEETKAKSHKNRPFNPGQHLQILTLFCFGDFGGWLFVLLLGCFLFCFVCLFCQTKSH